MGERQRKREREKGRERRYIGREIREGERRRMRGIYVAGPRWPMKEMKLALGWSQSVTPLLPYPYMAKKHSHVIITTVSHIDVAQKRFVWACYFHM